MPEVKNKFACVHGHFYQPPRDNPWLGAIEPEESALPYRDWNERVFDECYGLNAACPMAGDDGLIVDMADNYRKMSFNFGPTLLSWIEREKPLLYRQLLEADAASAKDNDGHGGAIAQPYYHAIMPLLSLRDKRTLVRWGLADFKARFGREAEGMWLPETAVDDETLEVLVEAGVRFTILSPTQAAKVREVGDGPWRAVDELNLQPTRPYLWRSQQRSGKSLAVFFYHNALHQSVVSGDVFAAPDLLARRILARFLPDDSTQLVSVAADGEVFGHHHKAGAAALAHTFLALEAAGVEAVNYAAYLDRFPPPQEVLVAQRTAWSCAHGLGRWTSDCGCRHDKKTSQAWREPLLRAFEWLARQCDEVYQRAASALFRDFWQARDDYARRFQGLDGENRFLQAHAARSLTPEETVKALTLLEMERERLAMFTSCGWFFDDVGGLEAVQCLKHAARALDLAESFGPQLSRGFRQLLRAAPSNVKELEDGGRVYERLAAPCQVTAARAAAQAAMLAHLGWPEPRGLDFRTQTSPLGRAEKTGLAGRDRSFSIVSVRADSESLSQELSARAYVYQRDRADVACWLSGEADDKVMERLSAEFQRLGDDPFIERLTETLGADHWKLDALYSEERREAIRLLMPGPLDNPARKVFLQGWARSVARLKANAASDDVLDYLVKCQAHGLLAAQLPGAGLVRGHLHGSVLPAVVEDASDAALSRLMRWLEALEKSGLPISVWQLRQAFWLWRGKILSKGARTLEREAALALGERLRFSPSAMTFERAPA